MQEMTDLQKRLFEFRDEKNAAFQAKLAPTVPAETCLGCRVPDLRKFAKVYSKEEGWEHFLKELPHKYYDENLLHGFLLDSFKDFKTCLSAVEEFLPFVDNWAVCDTMCPKIFKKHLPEIMEKIKIWIKSEKTYTVRFAVDLLMSLFLDEAFEPEHLLLPLQIDSDEYYIKMMIAWYYATALAKQWDDTIKILEHKKIKPWIHNKTIQKALESYRVTADHKTYLRTLKIPCNQQPKNSNPKCHQK